MNYQLQGIRRLLQGKGSAPAAKEDMLKYTKENLKGCRPFPRSMRADIFHGRLVLLKKPPVWDYFPFTASLMLIMFVPAINLLLPEGFNT